jgi:hypothetical protein
VDDAGAQAIPEPFKPSLTDPRSAQRFGTAPDPTMRSQPMTLPTPAIPPSAGDTGFDSTGSVRKRKLAAKKKPNVSRLPDPPSISLTLRGPPPRPATVSTTAQQQAARNVYAKAYEPPDARQRRPLPNLNEAYEPVGLRGGTFLWKPSVEVSRGYDTNPQRRPNGPGSGFTLVAPELNAKSEWAQHELALALRGSYSFYDTLKDSNRPMLETKATGRIDVSRDTAINLEGRYYLSTDYPGSPNLTAGLARLPVSQTFGGSAGVTQRFNHLELLFKAGADRTQWNDSELTDGSTFSNKDRDLNQYSGQARASYEVFPGVKPFVELSGDTRVHDQQFDRNGLQRSSKALTPKLGTTFEISKKLTGEVAVGYVMRKYQDPNLQDLRGVTIDGALAWQATGLTTATLTASSRAEETILPGVSGAFRRDVGLTIDHAFRRRLIGTAKFGYGFDEYVGLGRDDKRLSFSAALSYKFNREWSVKGEYRYDQLRSSATGVDYDANAVLVGLKWQR